ncbi:MAG: YitT family protein [Rikenellaceae bacterium]|jgi:uncharacterized membrane-anchored protein YitT (DUF2179 family)|nr:YitT family protein [Rikenellaceae bacterium]
MKNFLLRDRLFSLRWFRAWFYIVVGCFLLAGAFVLFITPYKIVPGGVYGLGIVLHHLFPKVQVGTFGLMTDIPLLLISLKIFGGKIGARTIVAAVLTPLMMNGLTYLIGENPAAMFGGKINLTNDVLLSCIFGGVIMGAGLGLILKTRATSGGTDIISMIVSKYTQMPMARCMLIVDSSIVIVALGVFGDWRIPLYSLVTIYVCTKVIDWVLEGGGSDKLLFIISERHALVKKLIIEDLGRGGTYIKASGMYTEHDKDMIFVVVARTELAAVQDYIHRIDPQAFMVVVNAHKIYGEGFRSFPELP